MLTGKSKAASQREESNRQKAHAFYDSTYDRNGRSKAACNAWRGFRLQAHWSFGHNRKGRTLRFASRTSTRHHGSFVCPSCFAPLSPQPQDALPCASFRQPCSKQAQRLACTFDGKPHCGAHVACRSGHAGLAGDCHNRRNSAFL